MNAVGRVRMSMRSMEWLHSDFLSLGVSQTIAAIGQIIGVRLLTEALSPAVFGEVMLLVGVAALATSVLVHPTMQALLRYYPEYAPSGGGEEVERIALGRILRTSAVVVPISIPLGILGVVAGWFSVTSVVLLVLLVAVDGMRMLRTTVMNATRQHHRYGIWQIGEAWGRPLFAYGATVWCGIYTELVLAVFLGTSLALYYFINSSIKSPGPVSSTAWNAEELRNKFKHYGRPLIPLGVLGWISSMADRYMIGSMLSVQNVGMYAAAYGIASRPMLMLSSMAETAIRPVYYSAVVGRDRPASRKHLITWFVLVFVVGTALCVFLALFHQQLAHVLLGPEFREASFLMPWIAAGYGLLALYHIAVRVCLVHDAPQAVTLTEAARAILAVAIGFFLITKYGLFGAAVAVPIYCGIQLLVSVYLAARCVRSNRLSDRKHVVTPIP